VFQYLAKQAAASLVVLWVVVTLTFFLIQSAPGTLSIISDPELDPRVAAMVEERLGLDQPVWRQYARWMGNLVRGDLGASLVYSRSVVEVIWSRLPATLLLGTAALIVTLVVGIGAGSYAARHPNAPLDQAMSFLAVVGLATPNFWLGILLILLFSVNLGWLPSSGLRTLGVPFDLGDRLAHLVLPTIVLASSSAAELMRYTRSAWLEVMSQDYVRTAHSKGVSPGAVDRRHVMRNALVPLLTIVGLFLPRLVGGAAVIESVFAWPGMGLLAVEAAMNRDSTLILGTTIFVSVAIIASNLFVDLLYGLVDPRIRY
jgi:peptide/nickel transport system permease protein